MPADLFSPDARTAVRAKKKEVIQFLPSTGQALHFTENRKIRQGRHDLKGQIPQVLDHSPGHGDIHVMESVWGVSGQFTPGMQLRPGLT